MARLPLEGVRVVDMTVVWSGPGCTMLLGDLGAEVIRVETAQHFPNSTRGIAPRLSKEQAEKLGYIGSAFPNKDPGEHPYNRQAMFNCHGRNKRSVTMDLSRPEGREAFLKLIAISDVFVENNALRVLDHLQLTYDVLREVNPRLIMVRMAPLGMSGPFHQFLGFGPNFNALAGLVAMSGYYNADPTTAGENYHMDEAAAPAAAFAVMAALYDRAKSGEGQQIEFAQCENLIEGLGEWILDNQMNPGRLPSVLGNRDLYLLQGVYPTLEENRFVALTIRNDQEWERLVRLMGDPPWAKDPLFCTAVGRLEHQDEIDTHLAAWTALRRPGQLFALLQAEGLAAGPVWPESVALADPHLAERGYFRPLTQTESGTHLHPGHPWKASGMELQWSKGAPCLGEDNAYVYKELLGYSESQYQAMIEAGHARTEYV
ncbi:MAG: CoA transferase [Firmicutes bacterium]|nr:CoA transferase [Bacillota bacterium]